MNKSDLINKISNLNPSIYQKDANKIVNVFFDTITKALSRNERVELRGFGAFSTKDRKARRARNPKTGSNVDVDKKTVPFFKCGKGLRQKLNET